MNTSCFGGRSVEKRMRMVGVGCFCWKISRSSSNLLKNEWDWVVFVETGWEWVVFVETGWEWVVFHQKRLRGGRFCQKMSGSWSFYPPKDWVVFVEKWVGVCRFCQKMGGNGFFSSKMGESGSFLSKNG